MNKLKISLFPLNGVIFFPGSNLPLNIFEERYLEMIDFSLGSNRLIGMIQTRESGDFYTVGCYGKINSFSETADGRYIVNLKGENYFNIKKVTTDNKKYITADIEIFEKNKSFLKQETIHFKKELLIEKYKVYAESQGLDIDFNLIKQIEGQELIKFIAMSCTFSTEDKQMLLETYNINEMGNKLISLFEFYQNNAGTQNLIN